MTYLVWMDRYPALMVGGEKPIGARELSPEQEQELRGAMSRGDSVVQDGDGWTISTYVPPPAPIPDSMSFSQLLIGLVTEGWITEAEGEAWLAGQLPDAVIALISTLPVEQRFAAKARAARPSIILRNDPLVIALAGAQGKSSEELDAFFTTYAAV